MDDLSTSDHKSDKGSKSNIAAKFQYAITADFVPPIGVFWDIENCQVPKGRSATYLVQVLRERFFKGHREAEFMCVCDISKERKEIISELNDAQVTVVHVIATSKNAADDKLKQCMRRFVDIHGCPSTVVLITSDVNFTTDISDFRYRRNIRVILIHGDHAPEPLLACAHEHCRFEELTSALPYRSPAKGQGSQRSCELLVTDIPANRDVRQIQNRLRRLSDNCGGKVITIQGSTAVIRFSNPEAAQRARKRMDKEDVFGSKISVSCGRFQDFREGSPHLHISRSRQSSNGGGSSRDSSPVLAELNQILMRQRSMSETGLSQDSFEFCPPPPPDLIRQGPSSQPLYSHLSSLELKDNCDRTFLSDTRTGAKRNQSVRVWNTPLVAENERAKTPQKIVGRPFQLTETSNTHSFNGSGSNGGTAFLPINQRVPSPTPLYTWNLASLNKQEMLRSPTVKSVSPVPAVVPCVVSCTNTSVPVELVVTDLDQSIEANEMKKILLSAFREYVMVLHVSVLLQPSGILKAIVKVPSAQDAQLAVSHLHHRKIGQKRIIVSYTSNDRVPPLHVLKHEVTSLLNDISNNIIPLFKFKELFENRYHRSIGTSDLLKLKDVVQIVDSKGARLVTFHPGYRATPSPVTNGNSEGENAESSYCPHHAHLQSGGWGDASTICSLPNVHMSLKSLSPKVHTLLDSHQGSLPLNSFCACYEAEFGELPSGSPDSSQSSGGVSLEHLITCIPGVQITKSSSDVKKIQWLQNKNVQQLGSHNISPSLLDQISVFGSDVVDLLKNHPYCSIQVNKFIPLYHHHFGHQCRVSDYGYTKLIDLLEAVPDVVQILGQGQNRILTLTHRSQVKRFSSDLLQILKSKPNRQLYLTELQAAYDQCFGKPFNITSYGVCDVDDIICELSDSSLVVEHVNGELCVTVSSQAQSLDEMDPTQVFSQEVIEMLTQLPSCSMPFNKFVPAYYHHFGRQCKVADFGFSKLIKLFEAIPDIVEISGSGEDKVVSLTVKRKLAVLGERMKSLFSSDGGVKQFLPLEGIEAAYAQTNGCPLNLEEFGLASYDQMARKLWDCVKVEEMDSVRGLLLVNASQQLLQNLLMEAPEGQMKVADLQSLYQERFKTPLEPTALLPCLNSFKVVEKDVVRLTPLQAVFRNLLQLLQENGNQLPMCSVEEEYLRRFGVPCEPTLYNFQNFPTLVNSAPEYFTFKGKKKKKLLTVNNDNPDIPNLSHGSRVQESTGATNKKNLFILNREVELLMRASPFDVMSQPIPSSVPSPELEPEFQPIKNRDLMGFESPMPMNNDIITGQGLDNPGPLHCNSFSYSSLYLPPNLTTNPKAQSETLGPSHSQVQLPVHFAQRPPLHWLPPNSAITQGQGTVLQSPKSLDASIQWASRESLNADSSLSTSRMSSAQDTPTRRSKRNRIAAHFPSSNPN